MVQRAPKYSLPPDILGEAMHMWGHVPLNPLTVYLMGVGTVGKSRNL